MLEHVDVLSGMPKVGAKGPFKGSLKGTVNNAGSLTVQIYRLTSDEILSLSLMHYSNRIIIVNNIFI